MRTYLLRCEDETYICRVHSDVYLPQRVEFKTVFDVSWTDSTLLRTLLAENPSVKEWTAKWPTISVRRIKNAPFKIIRVNETSCWDKEITKVTGRVFGYYLLDTSAQIYEACIIPSYNAAFLYNGFEKGHDKVDTKGEPVVTTEMVFDDGEMPYKSFLCNTDFDIVRDDIEIPEHADTMSEAEEILIDSYRSNPVEK